MSRSYATSISVQLFKLLFAISILGVCFVPTVLAFDHTTDKYNEWQSFDFEEEDDRYTEYTIHFDGVTEDYNVDVSNLYNESELSDEERERLDTARTGDTGYVFEEGEETEMIGNTTRDFAVESNGVLYKYSISDETIGDMPITPVFSFAFWTIGSLIVFFVNLGIVIVVAEFFGKANMFELVMGEANE